MNATGKIIHKTKVASEAKALELDVPMEQIGIEAEPLSQWLHAGLTDAGFEMVLLETRHVKAALSAITVARRIAQLLRVGWPKQAAILHWRMAPTSATGGRSVKTTRIRTEPSDSTLRGLTHRREAESGEAADVHVPQSRFVDRLAYSI